MVEIDCRAIPALPGICELDQSTRNWPQVKGTTDEEIYIVKPVDEIETKNKLQEIKDKGIDSLAVVFAHSYTFHDHELQVGQIAKQIGFKHISLSHQVMPMVRMVPRGFTACADAYLTPHIHKYLKSFSAGFKNDLKGTNVLFMQSDGGLTLMDTFNGARAVLSGPAGGVVGINRSCRFRESLIS